MTLTEDNFDELYVPIQNHLVEDASFGGAMFETYGEELDFVFSVSLEDNTRKTVWTIIETDGEMYCVAGFHLVNRIGFIITEKPWETGEEEFMYESVGDEQIYHLEKQNYTAEGWKLFEQEANVSDTDVIDISHLDLRITNHTDLQQFLLNDANTNNSIDEAIKNVLPINGDGKVFEFKGDGDGLGFILDIWENQEALDNEEDIENGYTFWFEDYEE